MNVYSFLPGVRRSNTTKVVDVVYACVCVWEGGGKELENRLSVWLNSKIVFSPPGSASTDVSFRPNGRATLKSAPVWHNSAPLCAEGEKLNPLFTAHPPPPRTPSTPHPLHPPLFMLAGGTIGEGLAQSWGGVAGQQNGLWILCLWILRVGGPTLTHTQRNTLSLSPLSFPLLSCLMLCNAEIGGPDMRLSSGLADSQSPPKNCEWVLNKPSQARRQEGPAVAHVEPASDWVAVNTNPAADYHWHGEVNSNKWSYKTERTFLLQPFYSHRKSHSDVLFLWQTHIYQTKK